MRQIVNIQGLRAVAVLLVIAAHEHDFLDHFHVHSLFRTFTAVEAWGVDLFFVISGFVMISVHWKDFGVVGSPTRFLIKRMMRIFPLYWLATLVVYAVIKVMPGQVHAWPTADANLVLSLALLVPRGQHVLLWVGWTLVFEMYFYYVFTATLLVGRRVALSIVGAWSVMLIALQFVGSSTNPWIATLTDALVVEFTLGVLVGAFVANRRLLPLWAGYAAIVTACVLLAITFHITYNPLQELSTAAPLRFLTVGAPMALLVYGAVSVELQGGFVVPQPLRYIGDASYSIYLTHPLFYVVLTRIVAGLLHGRVPALSLIVVGPAVVLLGGCAMYRWVERPLLKYTRAQVDRLLPGVLRPATMGRSVSG